MDEYRVRLTVFDGPLDLLLHLVEERSLDVTVIALAEVTDSFLLHVRQMDSPDPRVLAEFLSVAARLVLIKSRSLLPKPPPAAVEDDEEEDVGEALARQLREYQQFKRAAASLQSREATGLRVFAREAAPPTRQAGVGLDGVTLVDLTTAFRRVLARMPAPPPDGVAVTPHTITIEAKMAQLRERLSRGPLGFHAWLMEARSRSEVIAAFLALLELIKQHVVLAQQPAPFEDIWLEAAPVAEDTAQGDG